MSVKVRDPPTCVPDPGGTLIGGGAMEVREDGKEGGREIKGLEEGKVILYQLGRGYYDTYIGRKDGKIGSESLRPVSVVPTTASLPFLNPAVLVAMTTIL